MELLRVSTSCGRQRSSIDEKTVTSDWSSEPTSPDTMDAQIEVMFETQTSDSVIRTKAAATAWSPRTLLDMYSQALDGNPLASKCVTSGLVGILGDLISELLFWAQGDGPV